MIIIIVVTIAMITKTVNLIIIETKIVIRVKE